MRELHKKALEFTQLNCHIVLVSFGEIHGAQKWHAENKIDDSQHEIKFDMITDRTRALYKLFNLPRSFSKVWNAETLIYYAEQVKLKRELPKSYQDVEDDPHQMGGDFILQFDKSESSTPSRFKTIFSYPSKNPPDRPTIANLLEFLSTL